MIACWWCALGDHDRCDGEAHAGCRQCGWRSIPCSCSCNETMGELVIAALDLRGRIEGKR